MRSAFIIFLGITLMMKMGRISGAPKTYLIKTSDHEDNPEIEPQVTPKTGPGVYPEFEPETFEVFPEFKPETFEVDPEFEPETFEVYPEFEPEVEPELDEPAVKSELEPKDLPEVSKDDIITGLAMKTS